MNLHEFKVKQILSRDHHKSEIYTATVSFCPSVLVIKKATEGAFAEKEIVNEIKLLTKMKHTSIIAIRAARISLSDPFMGTYAYTTIYCFTF